MSTPQENINPQDGLLSVGEFAARIREKYPKVYDELSDVEITNRIVEKHPDYKQVLRPIGATPRVTSTVRDDDAAFDAPLQPEPEIQFKPFETSDLSFSQRVAAGGARIAGANTSGLPENSPNRAGKIVKAAVRTDGRMPSQDELSDALLGALGAGDIGASYRAEMGRNIAAPDISEEDLKRGYDPQTKTYHFEAQPTSFDIRIINAYRAGGVEAARAEAAKMMGESDAESADYQQKKAAADKVLTGMGFDPSKMSEGGSPVEKGIGDALIGTARLANNLGGVFGSDPKQSADNAEFIEGMSKSIPEEKTAAGRMARSLTGIAARAPQYVAAGPAAPVVAYTENLHRGQEAAIKEGLKIGVAGGVAHGSAAALEGLSPLARQLISRKLAGATNVALDKLSGSERSAVESFLEGALLPVGKGKGRPEGEPSFASLRQAVEGSSPLSRETLVTQLKSAVSRKSPRVGVLYPSESEALPLPKGFSLAPLEDGMVLHLNIGKAKKLGITNRETFKRYVDEHGLDSLVATAPRFTHPVLGSLQPVADQSGVGQGWVRVKTTDGEIGVTRLPGTERASERGSGSKSLEKVADIANVMRATQTAYDASALGRQAIVLAMGHPVKAVKAFAGSVPAFFSETAAGKIRSEIDASPHAQTRKDAGLYLSDYRYGKQSLTAGEEGFQSRLASDMIPGVRASERGFDAMVNKLRADVFDQYLETHPNASSSNLRGVADFINKASGRGNLGRWGEKHAQLLSQIFYSPKFQVSRVQLPFTAVSGDAKIFATKELLKFVGAGVSLLAMAKYAGLKVGLNPLASDWGKIRIGNTRISIWGGMDTTSRYVAQMVAGKATELESGRTVDRSPLKTAVNFLRTRAAPQISVPLDTALGSQASGEKASIASDWKSSLPRRALMPLAWRDIEDAVQDDLAQGGTGWGGAAKGSLSLLGLGANTISPKSEKTQIAEQVKRLKSKPENVGLANSFINHNARLRVAIAPVLQKIESSDFTDEQKEGLRHRLNSYLYAAAARPGEQRSLKAIERVAADRLKGVERFMSKRIEELKAKR